MKFTFFTILTFSITQLGYTQEGVVHLEQDPKIEELLNIYNKVSSNKGYYQIQVGFKTNHSAAQRLHEQVKIDFPGWFTEIKFREPTFRIRVGKFQDPLEAERRFIIVRKKYPSAMLLKPEAD